MRLPPRSLLVSAVAGGVRPFPPAMWRFCSFVSQVRRCWCPPFSVGHVACLFICLPGLSLLVSALFRWRCNMSIHLSSRSVTAGVRPFLLAMQHFNSFVFKVTSLLLSPRFGACTAGVRPFPLAMQHLVPCGLFTFVFQVRCLHCWHPPFSPFSIHLFPR